MAVIAFEVHEDLKAKVKKRAKNHIEFKTVSAYVINLIIKDLQNE